MANIIVKNLVAYDINNSAEFVRDLSEDELTLKGGGFWDWLGGGWGGAGGKA